MVKCNLCHKELTIEELDAGYNSDMYESKVCSECIKELNNDEDIDDLSVENEEEE